MDSKPCAGEQRERCYLSGQVLDSHLKATCHFYPRLIYCYCSVIESLRRMIGKTAFIDKCEHWRERMTPEGKYCDVYDGKVCHDC